MRFQRLDLNLLVALNALLTERSVSLAAERLCLSQSATSSALGRLRDYFGDELMVVRGRNMVLTARAEELIEPVRAVLEQISSTIAVAPEFDPLTSDRQIRIMASDYATEVLLADVLRDMTTTAPLMRFEIQPMLDQPVEALDRNMIDLLLTIDTSLGADHPSRILFEDDHVVVGWDQNPAMHEPMTRDLYFSLSHVTSRFGKSRVPAFEDSFMRRMKQQRQVDVIAPSFLSVPGLVAGTNRIATMHRRLARHFASFGPLVIRELPFFVPPIREAVQWHIATNNDACLRWVMERIVLIASESNERLKSENSPTVVAFDPARRADLLSGHQDTCR